jgi:hypothetical protein
LRFSAIVFTDLYRHLIPLRMLLARVCLRFHDCLNFVEVPGALQGLEPLEIGMEFDHAELKMKRPSSFPMLNGHSFLALFCGLTG